MSINVDGVAFTFPNTWCVSKPDDWAYYRNQFSKIRSGLKSVDLVAVDGILTTWIIEVKDYRNHKRSKPSCLAEEVACKVVDFLAMLTPAQHSACDADVVSVAKAAVRTQKLRVVLHLEQPMTASRLKPRAIDPAVLQMKLRKLMKPIDAHPIVAEIGRMQGLVWTVA